MDLKNTACYRLETMLYLEIQNGREAMKASYNHVNTGWADSFIEIIMQATKGCGQL